MASSCCKSANRRLTTKVFAEPRQPRVKLLGSVEDQQLNHSCITEASKRRILANTTPKVPTLEKTGSGRNMNGPEIGWDRAEDWIECSEVNVQCLHHHRLCFGKDANKQRCGKQCVFCATSFLPHRAALPSRAAPAAAPTAPPSAVPPLFATSASQGKEQKTQRHCWKMNTKAKQRTRLHDASPPLSSWCRDYGTGSTNNALDP